MFLNKVFLQGGVVSTSPNPQAGGPPFLQTSLFLNKFSIIRPSRPRFLSCLISSSVPTKTLYHARIALFPHTSQEPRPSHLTSFDIFVSYYAAYADDVNILGGSTHTLKENAEALVAAAREIGLEVSSDKN